MAESLDTPGPDTTNASAAPTAYASTTDGPTQTYAVVSMVLGIAGLFFGFLLSIPAVIFGHLAQRREPEAKAFWLTGILTGYVGIAIGLLVIAALILYFAFLFFVIAIVGADFSYPRY